MPHKSIYLFLYFCQHIKSDFVYFFNIYYSYRNFILHIMLFCRIFITILSACKPSCAALFFASNPVNKLSFFIFLFWFFHYPKPCFSRIIINMFYKQELSKHLVLFHDNLALEITFFTYFWIFGWRMAVTDPGSHKSG